MPHVPNEDLDKFDQELRQAMQRIGGGKVAVDSKGVRAAVRNHKAAAYRYVELQCYMAASQPGYLQPALMVAGAYQVEFADDGLMRMVLDKATELDAMDHLNGVGYAPSMAELPKEPPEREAARQWWKSSEKQEGKCDSCQAPLRRGEGYLLRGRIMMIGPMKVNLGDELLCQACFGQHGDAPRDPEGRGDNYRKLSF